MELTRVQNAIVDICRFNSKIKNGEGRFNNEFYKVVKMLYPASRYNSTIYTNDIIKLEDILIAMNEFCKENEEYKERILEQRETFLETYISELYMNYVPGSGKYFWIKAFEYYKNKDALDELFNKTVDLEYLGFFDVFNSKNNTNKSSNFEASLPLIAYMCLANNNDIKTFEKYLGYVFNPRYYIENSIKELIVLYENVNHNKEFTDKTFEIFIRSMMPISGPTRKAAFVNTYKRLGVEKKDIYYKVLNEMDNVAKTWDNKDYSNTSGRILRYISNLRSESILN